MQRAREAALREAPVEVVGLASGVGVDHDDRVDGRAILVVGLDAAQVRVDERTAGELVCLHGRVNFGDGRLFDAERRRAGRRGRLPGGDERRQREGDRHAHGAPIMP